MVQFAPGYPELHFVTNGFRDNLSNEALHEKFGTIEDEMEIHDELDWIEEENKKVLNRITGLKRNVVALSIMHDAEKEYHMTMMKAHNILVRKLRDREVSQI